LQPSFSEAGLKIALDRAQNSGPEILARVHRQGREAFSAAYPHMRAPLPNDVATKLPKYADELSSLHKKEYTQRGVSVKGY
jgi:hypothetical protein